MSRAAENRAAQARAARQAKTRSFAFLAIVVGVLGVGVALGFGDFFGRPAAAAGTIDVQSSMAGFTPSVIRVEAGATVTFDWWTDDAAIHLQDGVHTMISPELGLDAELPAESRKQVTWTVPDKPGEYDVWCDSCCGGKESPTMHGTIVVEPSAA